MREIKFRAWDLTNNEWFFSSSDPLVKFNTDNWTDHEDGELMWQQYTGLKDKNGKDIYEFDYVIDQFGQRILVEYEFSLLSRLKDIEKYLKIDGNLYE